MRIVFMGTPDFAACILRALADGGFEVVGTVTAEDKPKGRKGTPVPSEVKALALERNIPVLTTEKVRLPEPVAWIREKRPDVIVTAAFGQIVPKEILDLPPFGCLNVHASLLPAYRGAAPIQHAILDGCKETGVTVMQMDEGLDTGAVLTQKIVPIGPEDTAGTLFDKLAKAGAELLVETLPHLGSCRIAPIPQPEESTTAYASMIRKEMGKMDFTRPAADLALAVRAYSPWPGAYTFLDGQMLKIWRAHAEEGSGGRPGEIIADDRSMRIVTGDGDLVIDEIQSAGKKRMNTAEYLRGHRPAGILPS